MKKIISLALVIPVLFATCKKDDDNEKNHIYKGPEVQVYQGKAWSWIQLEKSGKRERLAITLTDAALNSVPVGEGEEISWVVPFHPKAAVTPFNHAEVGWNPHGHEPDMIYGKPHFDFHFYMMTPAEVAAIPPYDVDSLKFKNWPAPAYLPANYFNPGGGVPQMGTHWVDLTSGEFNGQPFTQTFIYGTYDGKVNFYEPMITLDFLKNTGNFERAIPQPAKVQKTGYYPSKMRVVKHDAVTEIILDEFAYRTAS